MTDEVSKVRRVATAEYAFLQKFARENGLDVLKDCNIEDFPMHLGQLMHNFRSVYNERQSSDAPKSEPTIPMLNLFGVTYHFLDKPKREIVLRTTIKMLEELDGENGAVPFGVDRLNGMNAMAHLHEPLQVADAINNTSYALLPDLSEYQKALKEQVMPEEFDRKFLVGSDGTGAKSLFWAAYSVSRVDEYDASLVRAQFFDRFGKTGLVGRTCEAIAALIHNSASRDDARPEGQGRVPYAKGIENRLPIYAEECRDLIEGALKKKNWIYLPETIERKPEVTKLMRRPEI